MYIIYWKWRVWNAIKSLLDFIGIENRIVDDKDFQITITNNDSNAQKNNNLDIQKIDLILWASDKIIPSPGVPSFHLIYEKFRDKIIWELDMVWRILNKRWIQDNFDIFWVTGTDGKSTVSWFLYKMFEWLKFAIWNNVNVRLSWNFEVPFSETVLDILRSWKQDQKHLVVIEISSFMWYNIKDIKIDWSIWTNIHKDHLNRHNDMDDYYQSKLKMVYNTKNYCFINPAMDLRLLNMRHYWNQYIMSNLIWDHNQKNLNAIYSLVYAYFQSKHIWVSDKAIFDQFLNIENLPHRIQFVREINGIKIYDDGKSTTAQSLNAWLNSFEWKVVLIAWWSDKWDDFTILRSSFKKNLSWAVFIGQTSGVLKFIADSVGVDNCVVESMEHAVNEAFNIAKQKSVKYILFSPGCASFDMFKNRLDRVEQFLNYVKNLK